MERKKYQELYISFRVYESGIPVAKDFSVIKVKNIK